MQACCLSSASREPLSRDRVTAPSVHTSRDWISSEEALGLKSGLTRSARSCKIGRVANGFSAQEWINFFRHAGRVSMCERYPL